MKNMLRMVEFETAYKIAMENASILGKERLDLQDCFNRVLAEDIISDINMPPFDKSAMDGYAIKKSDLAKELKVIEIIKAGSVPLKEIKSGECSKIMTGAKVPEGADCVIKIEDTKNLTSDSILVCNVDNDSIKLTNNICYKAEDIKKGDKIFKKGTLIKAQDIGVLASLGKNKVFVYQQPKVGVIATGDELVEPGSPLNDIQIRNSNSYQLCAQLNQIGIKAKYYGIVIDQKNELKSIIKKAKKECDLLLLSGGVSMGDFDLVPLVLKEQGFNLLFQRLKIKPGKPTVLGISDNCVCFGLPGNPVSIFVLFEYLVKGFIYKQMGHTKKIITWKIKLAESIIQKNNTRKSILPVQIKSNKVYPLSYHGAGHINVLSITNGFIEIPINISELKKGVFVNVRPI